VIGLERKLYEEGSKRAFERAKTIEGEMDLKLVGTPYKTPSHYNGGLPGFPKRLGFLHSDVLNAFVEMQEASGWNIVLTDCWRSAATSLRRKYPKGKKMRKHVQPPGYSGHNYGFSIDVSVNLTLKKMGVSKKQLDTFMQAFGFYCHRKDHRIASECWHYNALVLGEGPEHWLKFASWRNTSGAVEAMIEETYGRFWSMSDRCVQIKLTRLGHYKGEIDGKFGKHSQSAAKAFQRAWHLKIDGDVGPRTGRVLSFVVAEASRPSTLHL